MESCVWAKLAMNRARISNFRVGFTMNLFYYLLSIFLFLNYLFSFDQDVWGIQLLDGIIFDWIDFK